MFFCNVFLVRLDEDVLIFFWHFQANITSFADPECERIDSLGNLKDYINRFEATLFPVYKPDQYTLLVAFSKGLLIDPSVLNTTTHDGLVLCSSQKYQEATVIIFKHIKLKQPKKL